MAKAAVTLEGLISANPVVTVLLLGAASAGVPWGAGGGTQLLPPCIEPYWGPPPPWTCGWACLPGIGLLVEGECCDSNGLCWTESICPNSPCRPPCTWLTLTLLPESQRLPVVFFSSSASTPDPWLSCVKQVPCSSWCCMLLPFLQGPLSPLPKTGGSWGRGQRTGLLGKKEPLDGPSAGFHSDGIHL